jgi:hypothetical protein
MDGRRGWEYLDPAVLYSPINVPRILGDRALLIEPTRQNEVLQSEACDLVGPWFHLAGPVVVANVIAAPDGTLTAERATITLNQQIRQALPAGSFPDNVGVGWSWWIARPAGAGGGDLTLYWRDKVPVNFLPNQTITEGWTREERIQNAGVGVANPLFGVIGTVSGGDYHFWGAQCEVGGFVTSYIPTVGATARGPELWNLTIPADLGAAMEFPDGFFVDVWPEFSDTETTVTDPSIFDASSDHLGLYRFGTTGRDFRLTGVGLDRVTVVLGAGWAAHDQLRFWVQAPPGGVWTLRVWNVTTGGGPWEATIPAGPATVMAGKDLRVGGWAGGPLRPWAGPISRFVLGHP